MNIGHVELN